VIQFIWWFNISKSSK